MDGQTIGLEVIGAESLGVRGLCCRVTLPDRRIVIDPGVSLGYRRHGLLPHPYQVAVGRRVREQILKAVDDATDVVFSHFHGDHVPLVAANPYQLAVRSLPASFPHLRCWSKSGDDLSENMLGRFQDLAALSGPRFQVAEGRTVGPLSFSPAVPHGAAGSRMGTVMMTRVALGRRFFVHASDIQLLDDATVDRVIDWRPDILLAAGPPLYLGRLSKAAGQRAWDNAIRLAKNIQHVILDHHLMRSEAGAVWLDRLSEVVGRRIFCAADYMGRPRRLLEAQRVQLYRMMPVPEGWHAAYAKGRVDPDAYLDGEPGLPIPPPGPRG